MVVEGQAKLRWRFTDRAVRSEGVASIVIPMVPGPGPGADFPVELADLLTNPAKHGCR